MKGTIYRKTTGAIVSTTQGPDEASILMQCIIDPDYAAFVGEEYDGRYWFFRAGEPVARRPLGIVFETGIKEVDEDGDEKIILDKGEALHISNIPEGTRMIYPGGDMIIDDGFIEWETDHAGEYHFRFMSSVDVQEEYFDAIVG